MTRRSWIGAGALAVLATLALLAARRGAAVPEAASPAARPSAAPPAVSASSRPAVAADLTIWKVDIEPDDPVQGPADALVTVVAFSDFQSPPAQRAAQTLDALLREFPADLRLVWKDDPLPFNPRAKLAALFARQVQALQGNQGFWAAHAALFAGRQVLDDAELETIAGKLGLAWQSVKPEAAPPTARARVARGIELGRDVQARGTPHFFVNGVRLPGAQPIEKFRSVIEHELVKAKELLRQGIARSELYQHLMKEGRRLPPLERREVPAPEPDAASRGPTNAPVTLQYWAEFPCGSCPATMHRLLELEKEYGAELRIVWRHTATPDRVQALRAGTALQQVLKQRGSELFWTFHNRLLEQQGTPGALEPAALAGLARDLPLDVEPFRKGLGAPAHAARIAVDAAAAQAAGLASPAFTINGYYLEGQSDTAQIRRAIERALREASR